MRFASASTPEEPMSKEKPLYEKLYHDEVYIEIARTVNYSGITYCDLIEKVAPLRERFGHSRVNSAISCLVMVDGQYFSPYRITGPDVKPLAQMSLRLHVGSGDAV